MPDETVAPEPLAPMHCQRVTEALKPPLCTELLTGTPVYLVQRHADVRQVLSDPKLDRASLFIEGAPPLTPYPNLLDDPTILNNLDGLEHRRLRRTVSNAFTPRAIARWRPWVASVVDGLIDKLIAQGKPGELVSGFITALPISVFGRLIGLDDLDRDRLAYWLGHAFSTTAHSPEAVAKALADFAAFAAQLVAERRANPGDDLVSSVVQAADEDGEVSEPQIVSLVVLLIVAGHEVTTTVLGNTLTYLLTDGRETWQRLGKDEELAAKAVDPLLRGIAVSDRNVMPGFFRRALQDVEIGGVLIKQGSVVAADTMTANLDPEVYPEDWREHPFTPLKTPHLAFGAGPHYCLGAWLGRMELELALQQLPKRLPGLRSAVATTDIQWHRGLLTRSPARLPVTW